MNQERWCSGDSSHGQARGFPRHRYYDHVIHRVGDLEFCEKVLQEKAKVIHRVGDL